MILENLKRMVAQFGMDQRSSLNNQGGQAVLVAEYNPAAAGFMAGELVSRLRLSKLTNHLSEHHPSKLELSFLVMLIGGEYDPTTGHVSVAEDELHDLLGLLLAAS